jgi:glycosyltransferase involved in cell wall biosynthesis
MFLRDLIPALNDTGVEQRLAVVRPGAVPALRFDAPTEALGEDPQKKPGPVGVFRLRRIVARWKPDVVHASGGESLKYAGPAVLGRAPVVYRRIGSSEGRAIRGLRRAVYGALIRRADRVVAVAEAVRRETVAALGIPPERVVVIPNGADPARLRPHRGRLATRSELGIPPDAPVMLTIGALTWEKDPPGHLDVVERIRQRVPGAILLWAGQGPLRATTEERIRARALDRDVRLLGTRTDIGDLLAAADLVLVGSRSEGMPGVLIEAGMAGLAAAAYDIGGVGEVVVDAVTGLLAPAGDADALAAAAAKILTDPQLRSDLGAAARERCLPRFQIGAVAPRYLELYRDVARG